LTAYIVRRFIWMGFVILGMTLIVFIVTHIIPADPVVAALGWGAGAAAYDKVREEFGLDLPLPQQYLRFLKGLLQGDLGRSIVTNRPVLDSIKDFFPATLELALWALVMSTALGVSLGILSALQQGRLADNIVRLFSTLLVGMPVFWFGLMILYVFYGKLEWLPFGGRISRDMLPPPHITGIYTLDALLTLRFTTLADALVHLVMPVSTLALRRVAELARMTRSSMLEVLSQDYIRTARAKGLAERIVILRHGLKNASLPILTILGLQFGRMLGGAVLVESVFQWPGMGRYAVHAINHVDFQAVIGIAIVASAIFVLANLLVDLLYGLVDPRIRY
jgi:peptide/nickel transport system permease protein